MTQTFCVNDIWLDDIPLNGVEDDFKCRWIVSDIDGWWGLPEPQVPDDARPFSDDGNYYAAGRYGPRVLTITGFIIPGTGGIQAVIDARARLNRTLNAVRRTAVLRVNEGPTTEERQLYVSDGGYTEEYFHKQALVQIVGRPLTRINKINGVLEYSVQLRAADPRKYSAMNTSPYATETTLSSGFDGEGREYNKIFNYDYGTSSSTGELYVKNIGSYPSFGTLKITGPVSNPSVTHAQSGSKIEFGISLSADQYLLINLQNRTALLNGQESRRHTLTPKSRWFKIEPGDNTLVFDGTQNPPAQNYAPARTNYATNPSLEINSSNWSFTASSRTNLHTNPSFESTSGVVELRRNLSTNPVSAVSATGSAAWGTGGSGTITRETSGGRIGSTFTRATWTTSTTVAGTGSINSGGLAQVGGLSTPVTAGDTYTGSVWVRVSRDTKLALRHDYSGGPPTSSSPATTLLKNVWTRIRHTATVPAGATAVSLTLVANAVPSPSWVSGDTLDVDGVLLEKSDTLLPFFDGTNQPRVRENLILNPSFESSTSQWVWGASIGSSLNTTRETDGGVFGGGYLRTAFTGTPTASPYLIHSHMPVQAGKTYTASVWVRSSHDTSTHLRVWSYDTDLGALASIDGPSTPIPANTWTKIQATAVAASNTATMRLSSYWPTGSILDGDFIDHDAAIFEQSDAHLEYFDGSTPPDGLFVSWVGSPHNSISFAYDPDFSVAWTGTANASASVVNGVGVNGASGGGHRTISSTRWSSTGSRSVRAIPADTVNTGYVSLGGDTGALRNGMEPGKTYTAVVTVRIESPQTGTLFGDARRIRAYHRTGAGSYISTVSDAAPNEVGVHQIRHVFTVPTGATEAFIRFVPGTSKGDVDVWLDDFMLVEGNYTGNYFDGNTTGSAWTGTANASTSTITEATASRSTGSAFAGSYLYRTSWNAALSSPATGLDGTAAVSYITEPGVLTSGQAYTAAIMARPSEPRPVALEITWLSSDNQPITGTAPVSSYTNIPAYAWGRVSATSTMPVGASKMRIRVFGEATGPAWSQGEILDLDALIIETPQPHTTEYFDGSATLASWSGAAHASISTRQELDHIPAAMVQLTYRSAWIE